MAERDEKSGESGRKILRPGAFALPECVQLAEGARVRENGWQLGANRFDCCRHARTVSGTKKAGKFAWKADLFLAGIDGLQLQAAYGPSLGDLERDTAQVHHIDRLLPRGIQAADKSVRRTVRQTTRGSAVSRSVLSTLLLTQN